MSKLDSRKLQIHNLVRYASKVSIVFCYRDTGLCITSLMTGRLVRKIVEQIADKLYTYSGNGVTKINAGLYNGALRRL